MQGWALLLEYDGTEFCGWQRQAGKPTIQAALETAAAALNHGEPVAGVAAGRTYAGVHAEGQVVLLHLPGSLSGRQVRDALNFHLRPHPIVVRHAAPAPAGWSPRFSAVGRDYRYLILNRWARPALLRHRAWHCQRPLDADAMSAGAKLLIGHHDFTSFRATACQAKSPLRTLDRLEVSRRGEIIEILATARSFLHHQVRNMVGTLRLVGEGRWRPGDVTLALERRDRRAAGPTAPADGLCLTGVHYAHDPFDTNGRAAAGRPGALYQQDGQGSALDPQGAAAP